MSHRRADRVAVVKIMEPKSMAIAMVEVSALERMDEFVEISCWSMIEPPPCCSWR